MPTRRAFLLGSAAAVVATAGPAAMLRTCRFVIDDGVALLSTSHPVGIVDMMPDFDTANLRYMACERLSGGMLKLTDFYGSTST